MLDVKLISYVRENLARGVRLDAIHFALRRAGYAEREIQAAINAVGLIRQQNPKSIPGVQRQFGLQPIRPQIRPGQRLSIAQGFRLWLNKTVFWVKQHFRIPEKYRKYVPYAVLGILALIFLMVLVMSRQRPPVVQFFDNSTQKSMEGSVYYNSIFVGETKGTFNKLPKQFCEGQGNLEIVTRQGRIGWPTNQSDCKQRELKLVARLVPVREVAFTIRLEFVTEDTKDRVNGTLFIDGKKIGKINGRYDLPDVQCPSIHILNITGIKVSSFPGDYIEWTHDTEKCGHDIIRYTMPTYNPTVKPPVQPPQQPLINHTVIMVIAEELDRVTRLCQGVCPNGTCTRSQEVAFCSQYYSKVDLDANGVYNNYIPFIFGDYGVCEDRLYCWQITSCQCEETLNFDSCTKILCQDLRQKNMTAVQSTIELKKLLQEGSCQTDKNYDARTSWTNNLQGQLNCT